MGEPPAPADRPPRHDRAGRRPASQRIHHPWRHHRRIQRRPHDPHGTRLQRKPRRCHQTHSSGSRRQRDPAGHTRRSQRQYTARTIRSTHPAGRGSAHHGALLPRRHLARLGRDPRSRQAAGQPGPDRQTFVLRPQTGTARVDEVQTSRANTQTRHQYPSAPSPRHSVRRRHRATAQTSTNKTSAPIAAPAPFDNTLALSDIGVPDTIVLRGVDASNTVHFSLPRTQLVKTATMQLRYHFSPGLIPSLSHLKISLNGTLFATLPVAGPAASTLQPRRSPPTPSCPPPRNRPPRTHRKQLAARIDHHAACRAARARQRTHLRVRRPLRDEVRGPIALHALGPRRQQLDHRARRHAHPARGQSQAPARPLLRPQGQPSPGHPDRVSNPALTQSPAGCRYRRLLVRRACGLAAHTLSRLHRHHTPRQRNRHRRKCRDTSGLARDDHRLRPLHRHALQPLRPILQGPRPHRRLARRRPDRRNGPLAPAESPPGSDGPRAFPQDARSAPARRRTALAQHRQDQSHRRYRPDQQLRNRWQLPRRHLHAPSARPLLQLPPSAESRPSPELPLQRHSPRERQHPAGLRQRLLRQFDAAAPHRQRLGPARHHRAGPHLRPPPLLELHVDAVPLPAVQKRRLPRHRTGRIIRHPKGRHPQRLLPRHPRHPPLGHAARISRSSPTPAIPSPAKPTSPTPQSCCPTPPPPKRSRCTSP